MLIGKPQKINSTMKVLQEDGHFDESPKIEAMPRRGDLYAYVFGVLTLALALLSDYNFWN